MEVKRVLISLACLVASTLFVSGQVAIKTNVAMDALALPNAGIEVGLSKKLSLDVPVYYNPFDQVMFKEHNDKLFKVFMVQPELRYWFCDKFNGHFIGVHGMGGAFNTTGLDLPFSPFDDLIQGSKGGDQYRYKGEFWGAGISYGYQHIVSRHWSIEATVGFGYARLDYDRTLCQECAEMEDMPKKNYWGPTRAAINLIYVF